jgi:hypothetical protein
MSTNTFSDLLYYTTYSDHLAAALFFAAGIIIMSIWLINYLLVTVLTSALQILRTESMTSAFSITGGAVALEESVSPGRANNLKRAYDKTGLFWILVVAIGLVCQTLRSASMSEERKHVVGKLNMSAYCIIHLRVYGISQTTQKRSLH